MRVESHSVSPYEAQLMAGGTMQIPLEGQTAVVQAADNRLSAAVWIDAFSGRVPLGFEDYHVAFRVITQAPRGEKLSQDLILASMTHPNNAIRLLTAATQRLSVREMAVALGFNDGSFMTDEIHRLQNERGMTIAELDEAMAQLEEAFSDDEVTIIDLIRGEF